MNVRPMPSRNSIFAVSARSFNELRSFLVASGLQRQIVPDRTNTKEMLDMQGVALVLENNEQRMMSSRYPPMVLQPQEGDSELTYIPGWRPLYYFLAGVFLGVIIGSTIVWFR